jgi:release factor glutamine methyltransferase
VLLSHVLQVDSAHLAAHPEHVLTDAQSTGFAALAARRLAGEPVGYLTGAREFFSLEFKVTPAVLIPRPETELLVEFALEHLDQSGTVLDLGTGSGCIAISIAKHRPQARVTAVDSSVDALAVACENAARLAADNVAFVCSDWFSGLNGRQFDVVVANPPYVAANDSHLQQGDVRFEPRSALVAGDDGLECIRLLVAVAQTYLKSGGWLALEHGHDQAFAVRELFARAGYQRVFSRVDLARIERVSTGQRHATP